MIRQLNNPHVIRLISSRVEGTRVILKLEKAAFGSIRSILDSQYPNGFEDQLVLQYTQHVLKALKYLHSKVCGHFIMYYRIFLMLPCSFQCIIHRSIKTEHFLLTEAGSIVVSGFRSAIQVENTRGTMSHIPNLFDYPKHVVSGPDCINWLSPEFLSQV